MLYNRLRRDPALAVPPRTFFFAGKAAPAYHLAKLIIKLINNVAATIDRDPSTRGRLRVVFLPDYNVSLAERLIPASDVSEQISTAGYEASGTGNMKFMMNGALTVGTRDGATIEMAREGRRRQLLPVRPDGGAGGRQPRLVRPAVALRARTGDPRGARSDLQRSLQPRRARHLRADPAKACSTAGDYYMHLADLTSYAGVQNRIADTYADRHAWAQKAILNVAAAGRFSSDRTIAEYATQIWGVTPCPVP